jgi:cellulase/cellobiase CelA1
VASVRVRNTGSTERSWTVTVTHSGHDDLTLRYTWDVTGRQSGDTLTFTGGPVAPGATATFGYQTAKTGTGNARPSGCTVVGGRCSVS